MLTRFCQWWLARGQRSVSFTAHEIHDVKERAIVARFQADQNQAIIRDMCDGAPADVLERGALILLETAKNEEVPRDVRLSASFQLLGLQTVLASRYESMAEQEV